jgi:hypothetical protein
MDLSGLYITLLTRIAAVLRPGGRAALYTANRTALDAAIAAQQERLAVTEQHRVHAGGLWVFVRVLTPRQAIGGRR